MEFIPDGTQPETVLKFFEKICSIPHGSYHTEKLADYLTEFAKERKLKTVRDDAGNVIIFKKASQGCSDAAPLILQGHMDMVLEKNANVTRDLERQPIQLVCENGVLHARGTTLGGDDGIAVAMMLAILDDDTMHHPDLECVFTTNEEVGMLGADALDTSCLKGRRMLNLDSESEGIFTVGCAGGAEQIITIPFVRKPRSGMKLAVKISGLRGGHSGSCIGLGRANADILMARLLYRLIRKAEVRLIDIEGGTKDNAIPRECSAELLLSSKVDQQMISRQISRTLKEFNTEYAETDPDIDIEYSWTDLSLIETQAVSRTTTKKIVRFLMAAPNGLIETAPNDKNMPQTSLNLGILHTDDSGLTAVWLVRSSINSQKKFIMNRLDSLASLIDAQIRTEGEYPAWEYTSHSALRDLMSDIYEKMTGRKPEIEITHGGVECGLLAAKMDGLDCVSIGPDMEGIHTPDEQLKLDSVERVWEFVRSVVEACA